MRYIHSLVSLTVAATASSVELPERCKLPSAQGPCRAAMPRWYFNKDTKNCEQFVFGGCLPNENNFFTESECENACEAYIPHQELDDLSSQIKAKAAPVDDVNDGCNDEAFVKGRCRAMLNRWSWNPETLGCQKFVFGGCDGNGNNFPSKKKCEKKCSYLASQRVMQLDAVDGEEEEEEEEEEEPVEEEVDVCSQPRETGRCRARFDRFYYNSKTGDCEAFTYGGCEGNGNNFQTIQLCRQKCLENSGEMQQDVVEVEEEEEEEEGNDKKGKTKSAIGPETDACGLKPDAGFCRGYFQAWYFDGEECKTFVYGGCQGNANKFQSKEECENVCKNDEPIFGRVLEVDNEDEKPVCEQPIFTGPCRAMYPKFGFDGKNCVPFMYGGCMGNQNNFGSEAQCRQNCMMQNDAVGEEEEEEEEGEDDSSKVGQSLIMSREAIREAKKRERQADRKKLAKGKNSGKNKNNKNKNGKNKTGKNKNNWINNRSGNRVKGITKDEEDEMRFNFNQNMLTF
jgi:hypothetical protein